MFMQNSESGNLKNMEFYGKKVLGSGDSWGVIQNCVAVNSEPAWAHPAQNRKFHEQLNNFNLNDNFTQSVSTNYNFNSRRKETSIADWETYLYSNTPNPVKKVIQFQPISESNNASSNTVSSESWRQHASIADWEAYLYSRTSIPVNKVTQIPDSVRNSVVPSSTKYATQNTSHRAHISFVNTNGVLKPIVKRKRKRTAFTTDQVEALETVFYKRPYVSRDERKVLTEKLQVSDKAIKVWFQNRRLKVKKEKEEQELDTSDSETVVMDDVKPLAYVEAQINKADEFGYVTLDDRAINELVTVIDGFIPKDADLGNIDSENTDRLCSVSESESSAIYEPISPPDLTDGASRDGLNQKWETFEAIEPKKSLQNLLDVHFMCNCKDSSLSVF